jgi:aldose 1-epimerase
VTHGTYGGLASLEMRAGPYQATVLPSYGGHLVALHHVDHRLRLLREPLPPGGGDLSRYLADPVPYGLPLLFPPNRIGDGTFAFEGHTYRLPINEPALHNHLHGFFARVAWDVVESTASARSARVVLRYVLREADPIFGLFPHRMTLELEDEVATDGLSQQVRVRNDGDRPMPLLVGFHTALSVPFDPSTTPSVSTVAMNLGQQWELTDRKLPTGRTVARDPMAEAIANGGGDPFAHPIDALFSVAAGDGPNECVVEDRRTGLRLVYRTDRAYRAWMIWNGDARGGFFCPEPMTCLVNAPNLALPASQSGMQALAPGEGWAATHRVLVT